MLCCTVAVTVTQSMIFYFYLFSGYQEGDGHLQSFIVRIYTVLYVLRCGIFSPVKSVFYLLDSVHNRIRTNGW